jgi:predicted HicB family RNase H-like nuclease
MVAACSQCGIVVSMAEARESLNLRVPPDIKRQVEAYAERAGISVNAAACVILTEALREERRRDR